MLDNIYFRLDSFPEIPFTIHGVKDLDTEIMFEISTQDPEKEHMLENPGFKEELTEFLTELIAKSLERTKEVISSSTTLEEN